MYIKKNINKMKTMYLSHKQMKNKVMNIFLPKKQNIKIVIDLFSNKMKSKN